MSEINCKIILEYNTYEDAKIIASSISPDNEDYVKLRINGSKIICKITGNSPKQLLHTIDDLLACVTVAEETL